MIRNRPLSEQAHGLLAVMAQRPGEWRHGYELAQTARLKSGTLYPLLIRLEEKGLLEAEWREPAEPGRPPRHVYRITALGLAAVRERARQGSGRQFSPAAGKA